MLYFGYLLKGVLLVIATVCCSHIVLVAFHYFHFSFLFYFSLQFYSIFFLLHTLVYGIIFIALLAIAAAVAAAVACCLLALWLLTKFKTAATCAQLLKRNCCPVFFSSSSSYSSWSSFSLFLYLFSKIFLLQPFSSVARNLKNAAQLFTSLLCIRKYTWILHWISIGQLCPLILLLQSDYNVSFANFFLHTPPLFIKIFFCQFCLRLILDLFASLFLWVEIAAS